ncbi:MULTISPECIES: PTS transporter subunit EIIC [Peribacillus]|jgi:PTS system sucrose-specific IIC component|uniref:PTS transporter subunit EIIC n=1 Tax=Peribacillus TaxID=2675229 RepID=UPI000708C589|nr:MULTISPECIES: PTS transporter subunit EIIC [Peribacillus]KRF52066.1 PTS sugar transporter subunit IIC [Bacillus sp. Soil745]MBD8137464.1 PTS transporter subunit EIIC [Bacillus sp. CFBP 13597]MDP9741299.1 PTS system sucrose-specific IIC component [Bacillus sp. B2I3]PRS42675.1 PTS sugar transporter subunit IIC [Bacillus sp. RJGP41]MCR8869118.1 PTS transporter subunit EIIC [Peribacillus frigoritolerans]
MGKGDKYASLAEELLGKLGGASNVADAAHCMTRLRVLPIDRSKVKMEDIKNTEGVFGVIEEETIQIVLGPGVVNKVHTEFEKLLGEASGDLNLKEVASKNKSEIDRKNAKPFRLFLRRIASIFIPLIPALVASGLITGITKAIVQAGWLAAESQLAIILTVIGSGLFAYLGILVGTNAAKEYGGSPALGALAGILVINPAVGDISLFGENLLPGRGGLIGVLFAAIFIALVEKQVRKFIPQSLDIILTPTIALLITGIVTYIVFMPVGGFLSDAITNGLLNVLDFGGVVAGFVLGAAFLPLVITGLHQGLTPVHLELINSIGDDPLLPILAMGGAGQVGAAFAIYMKTKKASLKRAIGGGLPSGMLGIGEPLIFGVTLPLGRPFLTACLGAGVGGAFQAQFGIATSSIGVSGLPLTFLVHPNQIALFLAGLFISYIAGFIFTYLFGFKDEMAVEFK